MPILDPYMQEFGNDVLGTPSLRDDRGSHPLYGRIDPCGMQHREEPPLRAPPYRGGPGIGARRCRIPGQVKDVHHTFAVRSPERNLIQCRRGRFPVFGRKWDQDRARARDSLETSDGARDVLNLFEDPIGRHRRSQDH